MNKKILPKDKYCTITNCKSKHCTITNCKSKHTHPTGSHHKFFELDEYGLRKRFDNTKKEGFDIGNNYEKEIKLFTYGLKELNGTK